MRNKADWCECYDGNAHDGRFFFGLVVLDCPNQSCSHVRGCLCFFSRCVHVCVFLCMPMVAPLLFVFPSLFCLFVWVCEEGTEARCGLCADSVCLCMFHCDALQHCVIQN